MSARIRQVLSTFGWWQWLLATVFLLAVLVAGLFAVRTVRYSIYWRLHHNEPIQAWMTVNYVAHSYVLPADVLWQALGEQPRPGLRPDRRTLADIAREQGRSFADVKTTLDRAIEQARPPTPPGIGPPSASPSPQPPRTERGGL